MPDALDDLLNTPSEEEGAWWTITIIAVSDAGDFGPAYEINIGEEEKDRLDRTYPDYMPVIDKFELRDYVGDRHCWYGIRVICMLRSTAASRDHERRIKVRSMLQQEKAEREIRQELGML